MSFASSWKALKNMSSLETKEKPAQLHGFGAVKSKPRVYVHLCIYGLCTCIYRTWYNHGGSTKQNLILAKKKFNISVRISLYLPHASAPFASLPLRDGRSRATSWREGLKLAGLTPLVFRKERDKDGWRIYGFLSFTRSLPNRRVLGE